MVQPVRAGKAAIITAEFQNLDDTGLTVEIAPLEVSPVALETARHHGKSDAWRYGIDQYLYLCVPIARYIAQEPQFDEEGNFQSVKDVLCVENLSELEIMAITADAVAQLKGDTHA